MKLLIAIHAFTINYAKGLRVNGANNWQHFGGLAGIANVIVRTNGGFTWAVFLNKRVIGASANNFWIDLDNLPWNCIGATTSYTTHDLFATPRMAASEIQYTVMDNTSCLMNWTIGDGTKRIIVGKAGSEVKCSDLQKLNI